MCDHVGIYIQAWGPQNRGREGGEGARETRKRKKGKRERVIRSHNWNSLGFKKLISLDPAGFTVS